MIPIYDFCNHQFLEIDHLKYFYYDKVEKCYVLKSHKDYQIGE
jgi:hypothetical protein